MELYTTKLGRALLGDSLQLLTELAPATIDLVLTSPPFALIFKKAYGNQDQQKYVDWLCEFGRQVKRVLKDTGSFVIDLGGSYQKGLPIRSLCHFKAMIQLCDIEGFHLAQEFYWNNPSKLPSPVEWVNVRKLRAKDSVNPVWWLSKTAWPQADIAKVLSPYSARMKALLAKQNSMFIGTKRPSGHPKSQKAVVDRGGAIPSNLLQIPNTESNSAYFKRCKQFGLKPHPARFPKALPEFFIKFLTKPGDVVLDIFAGSNTTGQAAEELGRRWIAMELDRDYLKTSLLRFLKPENDAQEILTKITQNKDLPIRIE